MKNNYSGMILAAGFGKRMMPLTKSTPKPLIDINGKKLLEYSINFLKNLGCKEIIINTHYKNTQIKNFLIQNNYSEGISIIYENEILDTGGGIKNAIPYFGNHNLIVINSDIYWRQENLLDAKKTIAKFEIYKKPYLLLVNKKNAYGVFKETGDFKLTQGRISRFCNGDQLLFYSGFQIINKFYFEAFNEDKFSCNKVWDYLIKNNNLYGEIMSSNWYHVGDIQGLNIAKSLHT